METHSIVVLTGGTGTVKLLKGLNKIIPEKLVIITNTGDDFNYYGVKVSPDTDAVLYALSDQLDESKMWGLKEETFETQKIIKKVDNSPDPVANWFNLGDKDLAYCLYREFLLKQGKSFTEAVEIIKKQLQLTPQILPMADSPVTTYFTTTDGQKYHMEEFFIRLQSQKPIQSIEYVNAEKAEVNERLLKEIGKAKVIVIGPSNPISSIGPILAIKEIKEAIKASNALKIAISPIIGREAYSGPAKIYLEAKGVEVSPVGIFNYYKDLADHYYFDASDKREFELLLTKKAKKHNKEVYFEDIFFNTTEKQVAFADKLIKKYDL